MKKKERNRDKLTKTTCWALYEHGQSYNDNMNYVNQARINERFTFGNQWEGVVSKGLPTPQFNIFKRVTNYFIGFLTSSPLQIKYTATNISESTQDEEEILKLKAIEKLNTLVKSHWENNKMDIMLQDFLNDAVISGDMCAYTYWNDTIDTGNDVKGDFVTDLIDGTNVFFGNPGDRRVNFKGQPFQPYIIISGRATIASLKREAKANGNEKETDKIMSDEDLENVAGERGKYELDNISDDTDKATYLIKLYPETDDEGNTLIYATKQTFGATIYENKSTKMPIYPVCWANWDKRKNSYHGQALITNVIQNQIFVNKMLALVMVHQMSLAFGKVVYDKSKIASWSNKLGSAIGVDGANGDIRNVATILKGADLPTSITQVVDLAVKMTLESMGANDVLLGNVNPDNTSAIIQVTEQATIPLLNQKSSLYDFVEQLGEVWYNMIKAYYVDNEVIASYTDENGKNETVTFNPGELKDTYVRPKIDVGPSSWWNENDVVKTLDALYEQGIVDVLQYLERMPDGKIPKKEELIDMLKGVEGQMFANTRDQRGSLLNKGGILSPEEQAMAQGPSEEQMLQFFDTLPPDMQQELQALPDNELESAILELMNNPELLEQMGL